MGRRNGPYAHVHLPNFERDLFRSEAEGSPSSRMKPYTRSTEKCGNGRAALDGCWIKTEA